VSLRVGQFAVFGKFEQIKLKGLFQFQNKISAAVRQRKTKYRLASQNVYPGVQSEISST
jgi:hypothetical protein